MLIAGSMTEEFEVGETIGEGGMATIHAGRRVKDGRAVAVKVVREKFAANPEILWHFKKEAEILSLFDSPHIVRFEGSGVRDGRPFVAMELVHGRDLEKFVAEGRRLTENGVIQVSGNIGLALAAVHQKGIVHCDIKPQNIIMIPDGLTKLVDFGVAMDLRTEGVRTCVAGTCEYMSPEHGLGRPVDIRSDIYSLGVVLYELVVGRPPFKDNGSFTDVVYRHVHVHPPPVDALPPSLGALLDRCLAKRPSDRFQNPDELLMFIEEARKSVDPGQEWWASKP